MTLPDTVKTIPSDMFNECSSLREMNFPSSLQVIEYDAFWGTGFTEIVLPDSVVSIWNYAFKNCVNLRSIDLGNVVSLGDGVFMGCSELTSIVFPDTIRDLSGNYMFDGCSKLTQITFPSNPVAVEYSFLDGSGYPGRILISRTDDTPAAEAASSSAGFSGPVAATQRRGNVQPVHPHHPAERQD